MRLSAAQSDILKNESNFVVFSPLSWFWRNNGGILGLSLAWWLRLRGHSGFFLPSFHQLFRCILPPALSHASHSRNAGPTFLAIPILRHDAPNMDDSTKSWRFIHNLVFSDRLWSQILVSFFIYEFTADEGRKYNRFIGLNYNVFYING